MVGAADMAFRPPVQDYQLVFDQIGKPVLQQQVGGSHYTDMAIQPITYIFANNLGFVEGNVVSYISRWRVKGGIKDLKKAAHHIALLIEEAETQEANGAKYGI